MTKNYTIYYFSWYLNEKGFNNIDKLIDYFFAYVDLIKKTAEQLKTTSFYEDKIASTLKFYWNNFREPIEESYTLAKGVSNNINQT